VSRPAFSSRLLADHPGSDGVDYGGNPLEVSITTNSTGPLNMVALVSPPVKGGGGP